MSNTQRAAVALRNIIVGSLGVVDSTGPADSLDGVNTAKLPNGALAYVLSNGGAYRLKKTDSTTTQTSDGSVVTPLNGVGRWLFVSGGVGVDPRIAQAVGTAALQGSSAFAVVQDTWIGMPSGSGFYAAGQTNSYWSLNTTTGTYTYTGPSNAQYVCTAEVTVASATAAEVVEFAIMTGTNTVIGATTFQSAAGRTTVDDSTAGLGSQVSTQKPQVMTNGDTFFAALRNRSGSHNLTVTQFNLILQPA
jgi:hypothetical protein